MKARYGQLGMWVFNGILQAILAANGAKASWLSYYCLLLAFIINIVFEIIDDRRKENIYNILDEFFRNVRIAKYD